MITLMLRNVQGADENVDAYSAFATPTSPSASFDPNAASPLTGYLRSNSIANLVVCGIATDVCVSATVQDALSEGFGVTIVEEACKGVSEENAASALAELQVKGATLVQRVDQLHSASNNTQRNKSAR